MPTKTRIRKRSSGPDRANRTVNDLWLGQYKSVFRGRGMEFDEVREYQPGDDIRTIDWNVTARPARPISSDSAKSGELTVMLLVDLSASGVVGSAARSKLDLPSKLQRLNFSALKNNDKVGLIIFTDKVKDFSLRAREGAHVMRIIRENSCEPRQKETNIEKSLRVPQ